MIRWGILSTARIADRIVDGARGTTKAQVTAVGSRDLARARAWADEREIAHAYGTYEELLASDEVDAIYIGLPNSMHVEWSIKALEAGKHVLCEKPLSRHPAEVQRAFDAADRAGRTLMEAFMWRFHPQTEEVVRLVREGAIGELRVIRAAFGFNLPWLENVRWNSALEGGALMDVGCYCVSAARLIAGTEPLRVSGEQVIGGDGVDARFAGLLRFPDVLATIDCGMDVHRRNQLEVVGDEGTILVPSPWQTPLGAKIILAREETEELTPESVDPYTRELEAFAGEAPPRLGREDALGQARTIEALYRAAESGAAVTL
ncbi:Gfo/Idh/MocA family oxidoreductase [Solirubrobacter sp. CPCC 204708]|uniref:Gfo/Idh/MocA family oxidoreductase n=1 Tax=Solirubrobacter deserti TaxID=2282478 RepID=A0ABT4RUG9_9ACTN|nr:Gfo/Idh/MocA family oxidoreductase [Solirubrobacter deserti]MBE2320175.1 Gfo/Idh/MocA family oxidoreductase [Solirubrobacter deserti]MDA0142222.1 Gfo/Idh/MocA family oxidoreductase [Solirubrobacter deserti]